MVHWVIQVAVAWRQDNNHVNYEWLEGGWVGTEASAGPLEELVDEVLASRDLLSLVITLPTDLADEDAEVCLLPLMYLLSSIICCNGDVFC